MAVKTIHYVTKRFSIEFRKWLDNFFGLGFGLGFTHGLRVAEQSNW